MNKRITNISEAKSQLSALLEKVQKGKEVIIGKAGKPIAKLVPFEKSDLRRQAGTLRGKIKMSKDFDQLPKELADLFGIS